MEWFAALFSDTAWFIFGIWKQSCPFPAAVLKHDYHSTTSQLFEQGSFRDGNARRLDKGSFIITE